MAILVVGVNMELEVLFNLDVSGMLPIISYLFALKSPAKRGTGASVKCDGCLDFVRELRAELAGPLLNCYRFSPLWSL